MLSKILELNRIDAANIFPHLYDIFRRDFVESKAMLGGVVHVDPQSHRKSDGCEDTFWHLTSRCEKPSKSNTGNQPGERFPDFDRAARLEWVRQIIECPTDDCICMFYYQENNAKRDIRLYLWAWDYDFVVILQRLGKSKTFLVTSFYLDHEAKIQTYYARNKAYLDQSNPALIGCEWF